MANRTLVATFSSMNRAYDAARKLRSSSDREVITIDRGAIVAKDDNGNWTVPDANNVGSAWGLAAGTAIGALFGALLGPAGATAGAAAGAAATGAAVGAASGALVGGTADLVEPRVQEDVVYDVGRALEPGLTAILAEIEEGSTEPVDEVVKRYGGRVNRSELLS